MSKQKDEQGSKEGRKQGRKQGSKAFRVQLVTCKAQSSEFDHEASLSTSVSLLEKSEFSLLYGVWDGIYG